MDLDNVFGGETVPAPASHIMGQKLDSLSVDDLMVHIDILREEVVRLEADLVKKLASKDAAERVFGSPQEKLG